MGSSPAFSFYAKDFLTGTATLSLEEVGAYVKFLAYQWDAGSVPDSPRDRTRILGCTAAHERAIWLRIASKFTRRGDSFQNMRLEAERVKQAERRQKLAANGSKGGSQKAANATQALGQKPQQMGGQNPSLSSSSSFSSSSDPSKNDGSREPRTRAPIQGSGAFEPGSLPRDHIHHSICGPSMRFCLKTWECGELMDDYGGDPTKRKDAVREFVKVFEASLGPDDAIGPFSNVEKNFQTWMKSIGRHPAKIVPIRDDAELDAKLAAVERKR